MYRRTRRGGRQGNLPWRIGRPANHNVAGKAAGCGEALTDEFEAYAEQVVENAKTLADMLRDHGLSLVSGGTDKHLLLVDLRDSHPDLTGKTPRRPSRLSTSL